MWSVEGLHSRADVVVNSSLEVLLSQADACSLACEFLEEFFTRWNQYGSTYKRQLAGKDHKQERGSCRLRANSSVSVVSSVGSVQ